MHLRRNSGSVANIIRPGFGYQLTRAFTVHVGYAWIPTVVDDGPDQHEQRIWQQAIWTQKLNESLTVSFRARLEQRFGPDGGELGHRVRIFARAQWSPRADLPLMLAVWDEGLYQLDDTDGGPQAGFDQNRAFAGVGFSVPAGPRFEVGYLNVFLSREPDDHLNHALMIAGYYTL